MTYRELKEKLSFLKEEELEQQVKLVTEEFIFDDIEIMKLEEDYVNEGIDGAEPISVYLENEEYRQDPWELNIVAKKGDIFLEAI